YENEDGTTIKDVLREVKASTAWAEGRNRIAVIIGPEGGFSDEEARMIVEEGGRSVSLGKTTLRTETAGMAALSMIMYEMEL
ncbi:MAG: RNA methyltransferase, partial [Firmicutes bacterium]|nr:RNA methyltransferase [Bacillota bacterium]